MSAALRRALDQRRRDFEDVLQALEIDQRHREMLTAAASAWAKAAAVYATSSYVESRTMGSRGPELN